MWIPDEDQVKAIHFELVALFSDDDDPISPPGVKSSDLIASAVSRPHTALGKAEKYPSLKLKLAALFHSLTKNHAFHNGNKRTALVTLLTALYRNDFRLMESVTDDILFSFVMSVTSDEFPRPQHGLGNDAVIEQIASWISSRSEKLSGKSGSMRMTDFLAKCRMAGATVKPSKGGSTIVSNPKGGNIRISQSTREISGPVIRTYLNKLNLSMSRSGFDQKEFVDGIAPEREQVRRYMVTLRKLAKT